MVLLRVCLSLPTEVDVFASAGQLHRLKKPTLESKVV